MKNALFPVLVIIWILGSTVDYASQVGEEEMYRKDVCAGLYPDYKSLEVACQ